MTSAAIVMAAVFSVFATLSIVDMKEMGVGLAVGVLIDATIVRATLLPAAKLRRAQLVPARLARPAAEGPGAGAPGPGPGCPGDPAPTPRNRPEGSGPPGD